MINFLKKIFRRLRPWGDESAKILRMHEKAQKSYIKGHRHCAEYHSYRISRRYRCYINSNARIGVGCFFPHPVGIVIGEGVKIGEKATIYQGVTLGRKYMDKADYPVVGDNVIIYANVVVAGNIKIGDGAVIGCNSVVLRDVAAGEVVSGIVK